MVVFRRLSWWYFAVFHGGISRSLGLSHFPYVPPLFSGLCAFYFHGVFRVWAVADGFHRWFADYLLVLCFPLFAPLRFSCFCTSPSLSTCLYLSFLPLFFFLGLSGRRLFNSCAFSEEKGRHCAGSIS